MTVDTLWYLGRGSGVVTLVLLTVTAALGIATRSGRTLPGLPAFAVAAIHRNAGLLAAGMLAVHLTSLLFDPYAQLRVADLVIPFDGAYRPLWLGLGTVALDLALVVVASSLLRQRLGARAWRAVHAAAYVMWPVAFLHGLGTGSDAGSWWFRSIAMLCAVAVVAGAGLRLTFAPDTVGTAGRPRVPAPPTGVEALR